MALVKFYSNNSITKKKSEDYGDEYDDYDLEDISDSSSEESLFGEESFNYFNHCSTI